MDTQISIEQQIVKVLGSSDPLSRAQLLKACSEANHPAEIDYALTTLMKLGKVERIAPTVSGGRPTWKLSEAAPEQAHVMASPGLVSLGKGVYSEPMTPAIQEALHELKPDFDEASPEPNESELDRAFSQLEDRLLVVTPIRDKLKKLATLRRLQRILDPTIAAVLFAVEQDLALIPELTD